MATKSGRTILDTKQSSLKSLLLRWEGLLVLIFLAVNVMNICISPYYLNARNLFTNINNFMDKALIALPMAFVLLLGDIDLSVGGNVCLSATMLGIVYNATNNMWLGILACLLTGTLCGALNGIIMTKFTELAPMIVTLATNIIYRGLSERILGDGSTGGMTQVTWFTDIFYGRLPHHHLCGAGCGFRFGDAQDRIWPSDVRCRRQQEGCCLCRHQGREGPYDRLYSHRSNVRLRSYLLLRKTGQR